MERIKLIDGIECFLLNEDFNIYVDMNHDLSFYFEGSDFKDQNINYIFPEKNDYVKYGYEWGGFYQEKIKTTSVDLGSGLKNTNDLIEAFKNNSMIPSTWPNLFDKIQEFRSTHSDRWFLPSINELQLVYNKRNELKGLTVSERLIYSPYYWSSTTDNNEVCFMYFNNAARVCKGKGISRLDRTRLCVLG